MKLYLKDFNNITTTIDCVGEVTECKYLGDTLDYITFSSRTDLVYEKYSGYVNFLSSTDNYGVVKQYTPYSLKYDSITELTTYTFIDPTRILDELLIDGIALTNQTDADLGFTRLLSKIENRLDGLTLTYLQSYENLTNCSNPQDVILSGLHTVREILDYYLSTWDLSVRAKFRDGAPSELYIYIVSPNKTGSSIASFNNLIGEYKGETHTSNISSDAKNMVLNTEVEDKMLGITCEEIPYSTDSAIIETTSKIYEISNVTYASRKAVRVVVSDGTNDVTFNSSLDAANIMLFDFTDYVVDKEEYDTYKTSDRISHMYYVRGTNKIERVLTLDGEWGNYTNKAVLVRIMGIITDSLNSSANDNVDNPSDILEWWNYQTDNIRQDITQALINGGGVATNFVTYPTIGFKIKSFSVANGGLTPVNSHFDVTYTTRDDFYVRVGDRGIGIIDNQNSGTLDETRYLASATYKLNRMNALEMEVSTNDNVYQVGDYFGAYILDKSEIAYNDLNKKCHYHLQENYNAYGERVDVNRELRLYAIPTENYVKAIIEKSVASTYLNADGVLVSATAVLNGGEVSHSVYVPFITIGDKKVVRFKDNYSIKDFVVQDSVGWLGVSVNVTERLRYTDADGKLNSLTLTFVNYKEDFDNYPSNTTSTTIGSTTITYQKDAFEQLEIVLYALS